MAHAVADEPKPLHMGLPLPDGKLAMWLFLVTEIMFFTGLIGTYLLLRNGQPTGANPWPTPHDVHLVEWMGAVNTFVLICSSVTVVLCHLALGKGNVKRATQYMALTLALGCVFLVIKAVEYKSKFDHHILPGQIFEKLDGPTGATYLRHVQGQLERIIASQTARDLLDEADNRQLDKSDLNNALVVASKNTPSLKSFVEKIDSEEKAALPPEQRPKYERDPRWVLERVIRVAGQPPVSAEALADCKKVLAELPDLSPRQLNLRISPADSLKKVDQVNDPTFSGKSLLDKYPDLHLSYSIPFGNMWASCYFAMTGFHALHVLGGLVIFVIILIMAWRGRFGTQHEHLVEYTGLYWHFVDIVWIFLFPLLYLV